jgi:hypothetical protein
MTWQTAIAGQWLHYCSCSKGHHLPNQLSADIFHVRKFFRENAKALRFDALIEKKIFYKP